MSVKGSKHDVLFLSVKLPEAFANDINLFLRLTVHFNQIL